MISIAGPLDMRQTAKDGNNHIVAALGGPPEQYPERWDSVDPIRNLDPSIPQPDSEAYQQVVDLITEYSTKQVEELGSS